MHTQRGRTTAIALILLLIVTSVVFFQPSSDHLHASSNDGDGSGAVIPKPEKQKLHVLLPTTMGDVNLCKTILSARAMGYGEPIILGWGDQYDTDYLLGGGSHVAKISNVLRWLNNIRPEQEDDLVLMMDAFDIWFQLPVEIFIERYHSINERANSRIAKHYDKAAELEDIKQTIVFGAGKRCAPNQPHTKACYTIPASPISKDIYDGNTDTIIGRNKYTSLRQRYLNSGYIVGPAKDMRAMFKRTWELAKDWPENIPEDNGSGGSDFMYHGSDQAAFAEIFGQQEYQREVMRRRHSSSWLSRYKKLMRSFPELNIEGTSVGPDILNPPFVHDGMEELESGQAEFGVGLDYFSDLGHQTANADFDGMWMRYDKPIEEFRQQTRAGRNRFDCEYRGRAKIPADLKSVSSERLLPEDRIWEQVNLYTNLCLDTIPVMVHHNGDKTARERQWSEFWVSKYGKWIMDRSQPIGARIFGDTNSEFMSWEDLCPAEYNEELFRE